PPPGRPQLPRRDSFVGAFRRRVPRPRRHRGAHHRRPRRTSHRRDHGVSRRAVLHRRDAVDPHRAVMSEVDLKSVSVSYEGRPVVRDLNLTVASGEWLSLIGPNGAGKTTILRAIARLVPFEGEIRIGGQAVSALGSRDLARGIAMLVQEPQMPAGMSVSQYVLLGRSPHLGYLARESSHDRRVVAD